jgi:hypothetical protein
MMMMMVVVVLMMVMVVVMMMMMEETEFLNHQACILIMIYGEHSLCENQWIK